jgi:hypothetical protein
VAWYLGVKRTFPEKLALESPDMLPRALKLIWVARSSFLSVEVMKAVGIGLT